MVRATDDKLVVQRARKIPTSTFSLGALAVFTKVKGSNFTRRSTAFNPMLLHKIVVQHGR